MIRQAKINDAPVIQQIVNQYAKKGQMLQISRNEIYEKLKQRGVHARKYFFPVTSDQACFKNKYRYIDIPCARSLAEHVLTLPLYEGLSDGETDRIVDLF